MVCPSVREIIHSLKLVDYLLLQGTNHGLTIICSVRTMRKYLKPGYKEDASRSCLPLIEGPNDFMICFLSEKTLFTHE